MNMKQHHNARRVISLCITNAENGTNCFQPTILEPRALPLGEMGEIGGGRLVRAFKCSPC